MHKNFLLVQISFGWLHMNHNAIISFHELDIIQGIDSIRDPTVGSNSYDIFLESTYTVNRYTQEWFSNLGKLGVNW